LDMFRHSEAFFRTLGMASQVIIQKDRTGIDENAVSAVTSDVTMYLPLNELVDIEKERERLKKEAGRLEKEIARSEGMLKNENFLKKAPQEKVDAEKEKLERYLAMLNQVTARLDALN
ncbi:MAG: valine--tRNA ligase, partial [Lachnospiraceae bacterium]|nr:valine--tRNA ligase [Lachnospiraceae bacterium]